MITKKYNFLTATVRDKEYIRYEVTVWIFLFYIFLILVLNWRLITDKWRTSCLGISGSLEGKRVLGDTVVSWLNL